MKYIITESQATHIDQSKVDMGPYGDAIRKAFEMYGLPKVNHYVVLYTGESNEYYVIVFTNRYYNLETSFNISSFIKQFVPADVIVILNTED